MGKILKALAWCKGFWKSASILSDAEIQNALALSVQGLDRMEACLLDSPAIDVPVNHHFSSGIYAREAILKSGGFYIGHKHTTDHLNFLMEGTGKALVDGQLKTLTGPCIFPSSAGSRKAVYALTEMRWVNVHPTDETDLVKIESLFIEKSPAFKAHEKRIQSMPTPALNLKEAV
ncbi:MAG TPA: hypothetical protein VL357_01665 [Rariglobus sp.]|jgi:hypothetical protein|nr:hypothetical protein [Rariglobus sp.]